MANQKLTPRQKMINMMYLVLIAMLALNVSREILKSFHLFELSFNNANRNADIRNLQVMNQFEKSMQNEKTRARTEECYNKAKEARKVSEEFCAYVERMKQDIVHQAGGREEAGSVEEKVPELKKPDDMELHAYYFTSEGKGNGIRLQAKINETRMKLVSLLSSVRNSASIQSTLESTSTLRAADPKPDGSAEKKTWVNMYLENAPLAGVVTLLTKTQNDCKALESEILNVLQENINITSLVNDGQMAMIIPESQTVMSGEKFRARVALATYDTRSASKVMVNGSPVDVRNGFGYIEIPASGTGAHTLNAEIESIDPKTGQPVMVKAEPLIWNSYGATATISADNMNVLFIGLENPMSVSVPGITPENTIVSADNGITLKNLGNGKYIATVKSGFVSGKVTVKARMQDGTVKSMGESLYKIRRVPEPKICIGNLPPGEYGKSSLMSQSYLFAILENFYFSNVSYKVVSYRASLVSKRINNNDSRTVSGNGIREVSAMLGNAQKGDLLVIDEIRVNGPGGEMRIAGITYKIK